MKPSGSASAIAAKAKQPEYKIEYPPEVLAKLATLPRAKCGPAGKSWPAWKDDLIKNHYDDYRKSDLADLLDVSESTLKNRQRFLSREGKI